MKWDFYGCSDIGLVRQQNQDYWKVLSKEGIFLLADGMGGRNAGEIAAKKAVDLFPLYLDEFPESGVENIIRRAIQKTNWELYIASKRKKRLEGMGTTLMCLLFSKGQAFFGHVGDSRLYLKREGELLQLTEDHSLSTKLLNQGVIKKEESHQYKHILTKAIGTHRFVEPTLGKMALQENDLFLLCSDGLTNFVEDWEIKNFLNSSDSLSKIAHSLVDMAKKKGGGDNITVLLVQIQKR